MSDNWHLAVAEKPAGDGAGEDRWFFWESSKGVAWAGVIDGASSDLDDRPNGADYADALRAGIMAIILERPEANPTTALRHGIASAATALRLPQPSAPSAAVGLVRWHPTMGISATALGDVSIALLSTDGEQVLRDTSIADIAREHRIAYKHALIQGHGYGERHNETMAHIRTAERASRNVEGGYWIAADDPAAAAHAVTLGVPEGIDTAVIASDGAAAALNRYGLVTNWRDFARTVRNSGDDLPRQIRLSETADPNGARWPRSKLHDDIAAIVVTRSANTAAGQSDDRRNPDAGVDQDRADTCSEPD